MVNREKRYIDPMFYIPDGISPEVWAYDEDEDFGYHDDLAGDDSLSDDSLVDEGDDSTDDSPDIVDSLTVISQTLRRGDDGSLIVDVVVEVDDIPGTTKYEFRITKV